MKGKGLFDSGSSFLARGDYGERGGGVGGVDYICQTLSLTTFVICSPNKLAEKKAKQGISESSRDQLKPAENKFTFSL